MGEKTGNSTPPLSANPLFGEAEGLTLAPSPQHPSNLQPKKRFPPPPITIPRSSIPATFSPPPRQASSTVSPGNEPQR